MVTTPSSLTGHDLRRVRRLVIGSGIAGALLVFATIYVVISFPRSARTLLERENALNAVLIVCDVIEQRLDERGYQSWPGGWSELEAITPRTGGGFDWPRDAGRVRRYVDVDFGYAWPTSDPEVVPIRCTLPDATMAAEALERGWKTMVSNRAAAMGRSQGR